MSRILLSLIACPLFSGTPYAQGGSASPRPVHPCFSNPGTPAGTEITASLAPSRVSGVAPLAVYFDASGTTATAAARPFHELSYCWDFGDPASGHFATTGGSRNRAYGPAAGHVFETPGTYQVSLKIRDSLNREAAQAVSITVLDPDSVFAGSNTMCFSPGGDFAGCPSGAGKITTGSVATVVANQGANRRLLLHRGETFTGAGIIDVPGPGTIGAYGTGAKPVINTTGYALQFSDGDLGPDPFASDWRISDLEVNGGGNGNSGGLYVGGKADRLTALRVKVSNAGFAFGYGTSIIDWWNFNCQLRPAGTCDPDNRGHDVVDVFAIQDCEALDVVGGSGRNLVGGSGRRHIFLGNVARNSRAGEHVMRAFWLDRAVLSHNLMGDEAAGRHTLKMHAPGYDVASSVGYRKFTEKIILSDNIFTGTTATGANNWTVALGPQNGESDERLRDILVERNLFQASAGKVPVSLMIWGGDVTVRNNVFSRGDNRDCVETGVRGIEPPPRNVHVYHNTCYGTATVRMVVAQGSFADIRAVNNLTVGPAAMATGGLSVDRGNLAFPNPAAAGLFSASPAAWTDFRPAPSSPAVDAGSPSFASRWDFEGRERDAKPDAGAIEFSAASPIVLRAPRCPGVPRIRLRPGLFILPTGDGYCDASGRAWGLPIPAGGR